MGGGISCYNYSSPGITYNTLDSNSSSMSGGGISCDIHSSPTIANDTISNNSVSNDGGGVFCMNWSNPMIANNHIVGNSSNHFGGGILWDWNSSPTVTGNTISTNSANIGGGIHSGFSSTTISGNTITNNTVSEVGGGIFCGTADDSIIGNTITGNQAQRGGGIYCDWCNPVIWGNQISGNSVTGSGGGISCWGANPAIRFNVIAGNDADSLGDGIYCEANSFPVIDSNDIYNNGYGVHNADNSQMLLAEYNWWGDASGPYHQALNPGGLGDSTNVFVDPVPFLTEALGIREEMVARRTSFSTIAYNFPNPFRGVTQIRYQCPEPARVTLRVYNLVGQRVATLVNRFQDAGEHSVKWDASNQPDGLYFYRLTTGNSTYTGRCLLVR